jgi:hypothetical protein
MGRNITQRKIYIRVGDIFAARNGNLDVMRYDIATRL